MVLPVPTGRPTTTLTSPWSPGPCGDASPVCRLPGAGKESSLEKAGTVRPQGLVVLPRPPEDGVSGSYCGLSSCRDRVSVPTLPTCAVVPCTTT